MRSVLSLAIGLLAASPALAQEGKPAAPPAKGARKPGPTVPPAGPDLPSRAPAGAALATVNGEKIPLPLYLDRLSLRYAPEVREILIEETLVRQEAKRRKITANAQEVDAAVQRVYEATVARYGDEARLSEELKTTRGWTPADYKTAVRLQAEPQILRDKLAAALVPESAVSQAEVEQEYEARKQEFTIPDTVQISHILVRRPSGGEKGADEAARKKAETILKKVLDANGGNFAALAGESSDDQLTGRQGGQVPTPIRRGEHPFGAGFEATLFAAETGLIREVVPSPLGYHVIRVDGKAKGRIRPLTEVETQVRAELLQKRRQEKLDELMLRLRTSADIQTGRY